MNCRPRFEFEIRSVDIDNELRRVVARRYLAEISDKIVLPHWDLSNNHVFHLFVIRTTNRTELHKLL
jgi:dTDP-4-amino-4,6-dideoxygalactose transaminase